MTERTLDFLARIRAERENDRANNLVLLATVKRLDASVLGLTNEVRAMHGQIARFAARVQQLEAEQEVLPSATPPSAHAITKAEACERLGLSMRSVERAIARGDLAAKKFGTRVLVSASEIERFLLSDGKGEHDVPN